VCAQRRYHLGDLRLAPNEAGDRRSQVAWAHIQCSQRGKVRAQALRLDLEHLNRGGEIPQPSRPQIDQIHAAQQTRRRPGQEDLPAVPGGHHPCRTIEHRAEVVRLAQLGLAGRQTHAHRQLQRPLRGHRRIHRTARRGERRADPVAGVFEQPAAVRLNRRPQHLVMGGQRRPHRLRIGFPPTGRTLHIGE
jgi:hypothetical protein